MPPVSAKGKLMLSDQAYMALVRLEQGEQMNCLHTISRELIAAGMAYDSWGRLAPTEAGRVAIRRGHPRHYFAASEHVAELYPRQDPMGTPPVSHQLSGPDHDLDASCLPDLKVPDDKVAAWPIETPPDLDPDRYVQALRAAGVASGVTGIEADATWVRAFIDAWEKKR